MTPRTQTPPARAPWLARFGPLTAILIAIGLVAVLASTGRDSTTTASTASQNDVGSAASDLPIQYADAEADGTVEDYDFGPKCDPETGRVRVPSFYSPPCMVARPGVEGGATSQGVTADEITVVAYEAADDDLSASLQAELDPPEVARETREQLIALFEDTYEMWGRKVKVVNFKGTGSDETSARADAIKVAKELKAFASLGGPGQEGAYAEELARQKVICIGCGLSLPDSAFQESAPYLWGNLQTPEQYLTNLGDFTIGNLVGKKAEFAGSEEMRNEERVFGVVHFEQDPPVFGGVQDEVSEQGAERGYDSAVNLTYQLVIADLPEKARVLVARLKEANVTTVTFLGDPIMPIYLTKAATDQNYFPEWIITGTVLTDTSVFGRLYDQDQWAHAFGVSSLPARTPPDQSEGWRLHQWYYGAPPAATMTVAVINEPIRILMLGLSMAGPNLTPETFRDGLFAYPPSGGDGNPLAPQISFGDHGYFEQPDYNAVDDMQIIWWDAEAVGPNEQGEDGPGMMRYTNGGKRYLPGEMEPGASTVFEDAGSVTIYEDVPEEYLPPQYPSPGPGGN